MKNKSIHSIPLDLHETRDIIDQHVNGTLTVIWRNWDKILSIKPKMIYTTTVNPGEIKGPHLHKKRDSYFVCIKGRVVFVTKDLSNQYHEIISDENKPILVQIPKNHPSAHINLSKQKSTVLAIANLAWRSNDKEMINVTFDDYDWSKWKK